MLTVEKDTVEMRRRITFIKKIKQIFLKQETYVSTFFIECDDGTYGTNCGSNCGHCYQGQSCDKKTGACLYGCGPGYDGMYCNKSKIKR